MIRSDNVYIYMTLTKILMSTRAGFEARSETSVRGIQASQELYYLCLTD